MQPSLDNDIWTRRGISILWDAERSCQGLHATASGQPTAVPPTACCRLAGRRFAVGQRACSLLLAWKTCIDALPPDEAIALAGTDGLPGPTFRFQREVAGAATRRPWCCGSSIIGDWSTRPAMIRTTGTAAPSTRARQIPLSRCLFNGAQHDLRQIHVRSAGDKKTEQWIGLYHPRIS